MGGVGNSGEKSDLRASRVRPGKLGRSSAAPLQRRRCLVWVRDGGTGYRRGSPECWAMAWRVWSRRRIRWCQLADSGVVGEAAYCWGYIGGERVMVTLVGRGM